MERLAMDKRSCLFCLIVRDEEKSFVTLNPGLIRPSREFQRRKRLHQKKFQPPRKNPNLGRNPRLRKPSKPSLK
jgi:hypothetical protein